MLLMQFSETQKLKSFLFLQFLSNSCFWCCATVLVFRYTLHFSKPANIPFPVSVFHLAKIKSNHFWLLLFLLPFIFESEHLLKLNCLSHLSNFYCQIAYTKIFHVINRQDKFKTTWTPFASINLLSRQIWIQSKGM